MKKLLPRTISTKITLAFIGMALVLLGLIQVILSHCLTQQEEALIKLKEKSDVQYIEDYISPGGSWSARNGFLYKGFTPLGNGTDATAHCYPFLEIKRKTGTNLYTAIHVKFADPKILTEAKKNNLEHSNYLRVAGSTLDANGNSIVGTFVPKKVSDDLDKFNTFCNRVNVQGVDIFSYYKTLRNREGEVIGYIVAGRDVSELETQAGAATHRALGIVFMALGITLFGMIFIIRNFTSKMEITRDYLKQIGSGSFPEMPLTFTSHDEMQEMAESINEMTFSLKERQRLGAELSLAKDIQTNMLPTIFPAFPTRKEFDVFATMNPAKEVGGDLYDFFMIDEKHLAVLVADVSGKGVPAALFMTITKTLLNIYSRSGLSPAEIFTKVNQVLCEKNTASLFVTAWMGILNLETSELICVNAGHNPPLLLSPDGNCEYLKLKPGFVLAGMENIQYTQTTIPFPPGSRLFLYTDGVTEATNKQGQLYGETRLKKYFEQHQDDNLQNTLAELHRDINKFVGEEEQFDDITMLMLYFIHTTQGGK